MMDKQNDEPNGRYDIDRLKEALFKTVDYHVQEYNFTYAEVVGCLEIVQQVLIKESGATQ